MGAAGAVGRRLEVGLDAAQSLDEGAHLVRLDARGVDDVVGGPGGDAVSPGGLGLGKEGLPGHLALVVGDEHLLVGALAAGGHGQGVARLAVDVEGHGPAVLALGPGDAHLLLHQEALEDLAVDGGVDLGRAAGLACGQHGVPVAIEDAPGAGDPVGDELEAQHQARGVVGGRRQGRHLEERRPGGLGLVLVVGGRQRRARGERQGERRSPTPPGPGRPGRAACPGGAARPRRWPGARSPTPGRRSSPSPRRRAPVPHPRRPRPWRGAGGRRGSPRTCQPRPGPLRVDGLEGGGGAEGGEVEAAEGRRHAGAGLGGDAGLGEEAHLGAGRQAAALGEGRHQLAHRPRGVVGPEGRDDGEALHGHAFGPGLDEGVSQGRGVVAPGEGGAFGGGGRTPGVEALQGQLAHPRAVGSPPGLQALGHPAEGLAHQGAGLGIVGGDGERHHGLAVLAVPVLGEVGAAHQEPDGALVDQQGDLGVEQAVPPVDAREHLDAQGPGPRPVAPRLHEHHRRLEVGEAALQGDAAGPAPVVPGPEAEERGQEIGLHELGVEVEGGGEHAHQRPVLGLGDQPVDELAALGVGLLLGHGQSPAAATRASAA